MTGWFMTGFRIALMLALGGVTHAWAEADMATVETITAGQKDKVQAIFLQQQRNFGEKCEVAKIVKATALSLMDPVEVGTNGKPVRGRWMVRYSVDACGTGGLRTVQMKAAGDGLAIDPLVPGETLADATLQADVRKSFDMAARVAVPKCDQPSVVRDTRVRIHPATPKDRWQELWIGGMCGRDIGQVVEFLPTGRGTTFKMSLPVQTAQQPAAKPAK